LNTIAGSTLVTRWIAKRPAMVHIAMQEALDGSHVTWMEHVTDAQYGA